MATIGFIGLGHMGNPMVKNLLEHGHQVIAYDISKEAIDAVVLHGATPAKTIQEIAKVSDVIFTMLQTDKQVETVCLGNEGLFHNVKNDVLYIDSSSIAIHVTRSLHKAADEANIRMVDAPVSGGVAGAVAATLTIMVGGSKTNYEAAKPFLELLGKNVIHAGPPGNGQAAKICNNMLLGISMIAVCEAFALAEKLGLDAQTFFEISSHASGQCWSMTSYCPVPGPVTAAPSNNHYAPGFSSQMMLKDLRLSQDAAEHVNANTPLGAEATAMYTLFNNLGYSTMDFSGIYTMISSKLSI